jgi:hypothetical protein
MVGKPFIIDFSFWESLADARLFCYSILESAPGPKTGLVTDGRQAYQRSVLDARVSLPSQKDRNTMETLRTLFAAIQQATGYRVEIGTSPFNLLLQSRMEEGATDEPARDILERTLQATGRGLSWRLLYGADQRRYVLNLLIVRDHASPNQ